MSATDFPAFDLLAPFICICLMAVIPVITVFNFTITKNETYCLTEVK